MGYMKQADIRFQMAEESALARGDQELADTVAWYRAHYDVLPPELMRAILTDEAFFQKALTVWDNERFAPLPATEHVALSEELPSRKFLRETRRSYRAVIGWALIGASFTASLLILVVNL